MKGKYDYSYSNTKTSVSYPTMAESESQHVTSKSTNNTQQTLQERADERKFRLGGGRKRQIEKKQQQQEGDSCDEKKLTDTTTGSIIESVPSVVADEISSASTIIRRKESGGLDKPPAETFRQRRERELRDWEEEKQDLEESTLTFSDSPGAYNVTNSSSSSNARQQQQQHRTRVVEDESDADITAVGGDHHVESVVIHHDDVIPLAAEISPDTDAIITENEELKRQLFENRNNPPHPHPTTTTILAERVSIVDQEQQKVLLMSKKQVCMLFFIVFFITAVGIAIGITIQRNNKKETNPPTNPPGTQTNTVVETATPQPMNNTSSPSPTLFPSSTGHPTGECFLDLQLTCSDDEFFSRCENVVFDLKGTLICDFRPFQMSFRYLASNCDDDAGSTTTGSSDMFTCEDFFGGPSGVVNDAVYIVATDNDNGNIYYEGFVEFYDIFIAKPDNYMVGDEINITIYDPKGQDSPSLIVSSPDNLLQTLTFDVTCDYGKCEDENEPCFPINVAKYFGSMELVEYVNQVQGAITSETSLEIEFYAIVASLSDDVILSELSCITSSHRTFNMTEPVQGEIVSGGEFMIVPFPAPIKIYASITTHYTFQCIDVGEPSMVAGEKCFAQTFIALYVQSLTL